MKNDDLPDGQKLGHENSDHYVDLYELAPVGYLTLDLEEFITEINLTGAQLLGRERRDLVSSPFRDLVSPEDTPRWQRVVKSCWQHPREHRSAEITLRRGIDSTFTARLDCNVVKDASGQAWIRVGFCDITEYHLAHTALRASEERFRHLLSTVPAVAVQGYTLNGTTFYWNEASVQLYGYSTQEAIGRNRLDLIVPPEGREQSAQMIVRMSQTGQPLPTVEMSLVRKDGSRVDVLSSHVIIDTPGREPELFCLDIDLTARKKEENSLREQEEFYRLISENIGDFIAVLDVDGRRIYNSPSYQRFIKDDHDLRGTDSFAEVHPEDVARVRQAFRETVETGVGQLLEYRFVDHHGEIHQMESRGGVICDDTGKVIRVVIVSHDISARKKAEEEIKRQAVTDPLTRLPNRRLLSDRLQHAIATSSRSRRYAALMFIDLDHFKTINDQFGHDVGDLLLLQVSERLTCCIREEDTVARLGGDEFIVMLEGLDTDVEVATGQAQKFGEKILTTLGSPYRIDGHVFHVTSSIGTILYCGHQGDAEALLHRADQAMYQAKSAGRNTQRIVIAGGGNKPDDSISSGAARSI